MPLESINTESGPVNIKRIEKVRKSVANTFKRFTNIPLADAWFNPFLRKITVNPELDKFSTIVNVAQGNLQNVSGVLLAHEAVHTHQIAKQKIFNPIELLKMENDAWIMQEKEPDLSINEARRLQVRSRDLNIILESQAFILEYMLKGADENFDQESILAAKSLLKGIKEKKSDPAFIELFEKFGINDNSLSQLSESYSKNRFLSILDSVVKRVKKYLPRKDRGDENYLDRMQSATLQIIRLLDQGVNHCQITDLVRDNYESINSGKEYDQSSQKYKFLQRAIEEHSSQEQIDDDSLLKKFNQQMENRVMKVRNIAMEELIKK